MGRTWLFLGACAVVLGVTLAENEVVVETKQGKVEGRRFDLFNGKSINRWHGIPFAKAPSGERRFQNPQEPEPYDGILEAHKLPASCPQYPGGLIWLTQPLWSTFSEDCLNMNIYAPADMSKGPYAVMVYFHGGGYISSANIQYPGHFLAAKDVVVVVPNYRIGALGYMSAKDGAANGNYGLADQVRALEWVRDNIAVFGGDADRVTLFGQSAGAASNSLLMMSPKAEGLFHHVICHSGSAQAMWATNPPGSKPETYTEAVAKTKNCPTDDGHKMMDCLRKLPFKDLQSETFDCTPGYFCQGFAPVVDGEDGFVPEEPIEMRRKGRFQKVKLLSGHCKDDGAMYTVILSPDSMKGGYNRTKYHQVLRHDLMDMFIDRAPEAEEQVLNLLDWYYTRWPNMDDEDKNRDAVNELITDFAWGAPNDVQIRSQSQYNDTYYYILGYRSKKAAAIIPEWIGVPHNAELPYVFAWPLLQKDAAVRFDAGIIIDIVAWDEEDIEWSEYFTTMWSNFAKTGNPTPTPLKTPGDKGDITWPKYDTQNYKYINFGQEKTDVMKEYRQRSIKMWHSYFPYVSDYKLFPAGEPLEHPKSANEKILDHKRRSAEDDAGFSTPPTGRKRFNTGVFQARYNAWFGDMATKAMEKYGLKLQE